jgi:hypothetical protein
MPGTSTPISPTQLKAALKKFGCKVRYIDGWETRNRGSRGDGWGPVYGFMVHHTGDDAADSIDRQVIINGRSDLPGPLAQFGLNDDGTVDVIGWGRANHAGPGDPDVLKVVISENYGSYPPAPNEKITDGNARFWGVETYYSGSHKPVQYDAMVNLAAAVCDAQGWTGKSVIGHKEWNYNKPDPGYVDMAKFRADVDARIKAVNGSTPTSPINPPPTGGTMALTEADARTVWGADIINNPNPKDTANPYWTPASYLIWTKRDTEKANATLAELTKKVDDLIKAVGALTPPTPPA